MSDCEACLCSADDGWLVIALEDARTRLATAEGELARLNGMTCETCALSHGTDYLVCYATKHYTHVDGKMFFGCEVFGNGCRAWKARTA